MLRESHNAIAAAQAPLGRCCRSLPAWRNSVAATFHTACKNSARNKKPLWHKRFLSIQTLEYIVRCKRAGKMLVNLDLDGCVV
ncbi:MAG: hypothetical protein CR217_15430 [Beijerinckiaceae bacterium]|nr:MAG: hypothetical protein CR217_15430 [Beijerinckiaceae bacterium]